MDSCMVGKSRKWRPPVSTECLLCVRHSSKNFKYVAWFNSQNSFLMRCTIPIKKWENRGSGTLSGNLGLEPLEGAESRFRPRLAGAGRCTHSLCSRLPTLQLELILQKWNWIKSVPEVEIQDRTWPPVQSLIWPWSMPGFLKTGLGQSSASQQQKPRYKHGLLASSVLLVS